MPAKLRCYVYTLSASACSSFPYSCIQRCKIYIYMDRDTDETNETKKENLNKIKEKLFLLLEVVLIVSLSVCLSYYILYICYVGHDDCIRARKVYNHIHIASTKTTNGLFDRVAVSAVCLLVFYFILDSSTLFYHFFFSFSSLFSSYFFP